MRKTSRFQVRLSYYYFFCLSPSLEEEDKPFVVAFDYQNKLVQEVDEEKNSTQFILVISTKKLLQRQVNSPYIQVDATYKMLTLNYPLLVRCFK